MHRKLYILCYDEHEGRKDRSSRAPASLFQEMPTEKYMMCFDILTALQQNKYPAPAEWLNDMIVCVICVCVSVSFIHVNCDLSSRLLMHRSFFLFFFFVGLFRRRRTGEYTAQLVQERGAAAQHFCCHGEHGFRCLHRGGNRDLLNRYTAAADVDDDDVSTLYVIRGRNQTCGPPPAQEVICTSSAPLAPDEGSNCD